MADKRRPQQRLPQIRTHALNADQQTRVQAFELSVKLNRTDATLEQKMQVAVWILGEE